jgi:hypothetical protein
MALEFVVRPMTAETRPVVERLWQLYRHDLSEFRGTHGPSGFRGSLPVARDTARRLDHDHRRLVVEAVPPLAARDDREDLAVLRFAADHVAHRLSA